VGVELRVEAAAVARRAAPTRRGGVPVWAGGGGLREQCWGRADAHLDWGVQVRSVCLAEYMQYPVPLPSTRPDAPIHASDALPFAGDPLR
jgi:hypothetical protein